MICAVCSDSEVFGTYHSACAGGSESSAYCFECLLAGAEPVSALVVEFRSAGATNRTDLSKFDLPTLVATLARARVAESDFWARVNAPERGEPCRALN